MYAASREAGQPVIAGERTRTADRGTRAGLFIERAVRLAALPCGSRAANFRGVIQVRLIAAARADELKHVCVAALETTIFDATGRRRRTAMLP